MRTAKEGWQEKQGQIQPTLCGRRHKPAVRDTYLPPGMRGTAGGSPQRRRSREPGAAGRVRRITHGTRPTLRKGTARCVPPMLHHGHRCVRMRHGSAHIKRATLHGSSPCGVTQHIIRAGYGGNRLPPYPTLLHSDRRRYPRHRHRSLGETLGADTERVESVRSVGARLQSPLR